MNKPVVPVLELDSVRYRWPTQCAGLSIDAFSMLPGERVFLYGPSGSGKSTLLNLIAGTLRPQAGRVAVAGADMVSLSAARRDRHRADYIGVIFQQFNLLPFLTLLGNVVLPCRFSSVRRAAAVSRYGSPEQAARQLLDALGLRQAVEAGVSVSELSVGQQQRVAVARALIGAPALVLADEPTSALDADARRDFMHLLLQETERTGASVLFVSHDTGLAFYFDRSMDLTVLANPPDTGEVATI